MNTTYSNSTPFQKIKRHRVTRAIAILLVLSFFVQNIVWANPDLFSSNHNTLQTKTLLTDRDSSHRAIGDLIQEQIEKPDPETGKVTIAAINSNLDQLSRWIAQYAMDFGVKEYEVNQDATEIIVAFVDGTRIRYYYPHETDPRLQPWPDAEIIELKGQGQKKYFVHKQVISTDSQIGKKGHNVELAEISLPYERLEFVNEYDGVYIEYDRDRFINAQHEYYAAEELNDQKPFTLSAIKRKEEKDGGGARAGIVQFCMASALRLLFERTERSSNTEKRNVIINFIYSGLERHNGIIIRVAKKIPQNSALYEGKGPNGENVLVLNEDFIMDIMRSFAVTYGIEDGMRDALSLMEAEKAPKAERDRLRERLAKYDPYLSIWPLSERLFHELSHSDEFREEPEEVDEECETVYREYLLLKYVLLDENNEDFKEDVDLHMQVKQYLYRSRLYYKFLYSLIDLENKEAKRRIEEYVREKYSKFIPDLKAHPAGSADEMDDSEESLREEISDIESRIMDDRVGLTNTISYFGRLRSLAIDRSTPESIMELIVSVLEAIMRSGDKMRSDKVAFDNTLGSIATLGIIAREAPDNIARRRAAHILAVEFTSGRLPDHNATFLVEINLVAERGSVDTAEIAIDALMHALRRRDTGDEYIGPIINIVADEDVPMENRKLVLSELEERFKYAAPERTILLYMRILLEIAKIDAMRESINSLISNALFGDMPLDNHKTRMVLILAADGDDVAIRALRAVAADSKSGPELHQIISSKPAWPREALQRIDIFPDRRGLGSDERGEAFPGGALMIFFIVGIAAVIAGVISGVNIPLPLVLALSGIFAAMPAMVMPSSVWRDEGGKVIEVYQDGRLISTYQGRIPYNEFSQLDGVTIRHRVKKSGALIVGGRHWASFYKHPNRLIEADIENGFITKVRIYKEDPQQGIEKEIVFSQLIDKDTQKIVWTWQRSLSASRLNQLAQEHPRLLLKNHRLKEKSATLIFAMVLWATFTKYPDRFIEADIEDGFVTKVRIYKDDSQEEVEEEIEFSQLIDRDTNRIVHTWYGQLTSTRFGQLAQKYPRLLLKHKLSEEFGQLTLGGKIIYTMFTKYPGRFIEADIEDGFVTKVRICKENREEGIEDEVDFFQLIDRDAGKIVCTWRETLPPNTFDRLTLEHPKLLLKNFRLSEQRGHLTLGGQGTLATFTKYPDRFIEADIEDGFVTKVRIYKDDSQEEVEEEIEFSQLIDRDTNRIVHTWYGQLTSTRFGQLAQKYPRLLLKNHRLDAVGNLSFANRIHGQFKRFPNHEIEIEIENGTVSIAYLIWEENGLKFKSRVGPGYGRIKRKLFSREEAFRNELAHALRIQGIESSRSIAVAEALVRLYSESLNILVKYKLITEGMKDAVIELDVARINTIELAHRIKANMRRYAQLGFRERDIDKIMKTRLFPASFIEYLQRTYHLGRSRALITNSLNSSNPEVYIRHRRDLLSRRGTLDRKRHLRLYNPDELRLLNQTQRLSLLEKLKIYSAILDILSKGIKGIEERIEYEWVKKLPQGYELTLKREPSQIKVGDILYIEDFPFVLEVKSINENKLIVTEESGTELDLPPKGTVIHTPLNVTYNVQKWMLDRIISNLSNSDLKTTGFTAIDRILRLTKDTSATDLKLQRLGRFFNTDIKRRRTISEDGEEIWVGDESQEVAIKLALSNSKTKIIHGPPGTGKTTVIAEMIRHFTRKGKKVLLVSQMNQAVDNALKEVIDEVPALRIGNDEEPLRIYGTDKVWIHNENAVAEFERRRKRIKGFLFAGTTIGVATDSSGLKKVGEKSFDVVIMDEASRETLTGSFVPLQYLKDNGNLILVGDTKQLKPFRTVEQIDLAKRSGINPHDIDFFFASILSQVEGRNVADEVLLSTNWRSHPLISGLFSEVFYDGAIQRRGWEDFTPDTLSLKIIDIGAEEDRYFEDRIGTSYQNTKSAQEVIKLLKYYVSKKNIPPEKITIITAYKAQEELLTGLIQASESRYRGARITTIDSYQGGENDTIIIDFVRSNRRGEIGFVKDINRLNVALSRAKENLAIVWDSRVFMREPERVLPQDREVREALKKIQEYYMREVWQFYPEELPPVSKEFLRDERGRAFPGGALMIFFIVGIAAVIAGVISGVNIPLPLVLALSGIFAAMPAMMMPSSIGPHELGGVDPELIEMTRAAWPNCKVEVRRMGRGGRITVKKLIENLKVEKTFIDRIAPEDYRIPENVMPHLERFLERAGLTLQEIEILDMRYARGFDLGYIDGRLDRRVERTKGLQLPEELAKEMAPLVPTEITATDIVNLIINAKEKLRKILPDLRKTLPEGLRLWLDRLCKDEEYNRFVYVAQLTRGKGAWHLALCGEKGSERFVTKMEKLDEAPQVVRDGRDYFYGYNRRCEIDKGNRIRVPEGFFEYAGITDTAILIYHADADYVEIWSPENLETFLMDANIKALATDETEARRRDYWSVVWNRRSGTSIIGDVSPELLELFVLQSLRNFAQTGRVGRIIDFGAGNLYLSVKAKRELPNSEVVAVDFADIDDTVKFPGSEDIQFVRASVEATGLDESQFDAAIARWIFEYVNRNVAIRELHRLLRPGGRAVVVLHHPAFIPFVREAIVYNRDLLEYYEFLKDLSNGKKVSDGEREEKFGRILSHGASRLDNDFLLSITGHAMKLGRMSPEKRQTPEGKREIQKFNNRIDEEIKRATGEIEVFSPLINEPGRIFPDISKAREFFENNGFRVVSIEGEDGIIRDRASGDILGYGLVVEKQLEEGQTDDGAGEVHDSGVAPDGGGAGLVTDEIIKASIEEALKLVPKGDQIGALKIVENLLQRLQESQTTRYGGILLIVNKLWSVLEKGASAHPSTEMRDAIGLLRLILAQVAVLEGKYEEAASIAEEVRNKAGHPKDIRDLAREIMDGISLNVRKSPPNYGAGEVHDSSTTEEETKPAPIDHGKTPSWQSEEGIAQNIERMMPLFVKGLDEWVSSVPEGEPIYLFLDKPRAESAKIRGLIEEHIIKPLMRINYNNGDIIKILKRLQVIDQEKVEEIKRRKGGKPLNSKHVIILTDEENREKREAEFVNAFITSLDLSALHAETGFDWETYYYPYIEAVFFAITRTLGYDTGYLWEIYQGIPNIDTTGMNEKAFVEQCFNPDGTPKRAVILRLLPNIQRFNYEKVYQNIEKLIQSA